MLYLALEGSRPLGGSSRHVLLDVDEVVLGRGPERAWTRSMVDGRRVLQLTIPDSWMSTTHARLSLSSDRATVQLADAGSMNGSQVNGVPVSTTTLASGDIIELGCSFLMYVDAEDCDVRESMLLDETTTPDVHGMATLLPNLRMQMRRLKKIAKSTASVIVHGESGTGKELIARGIHETSGRKGPFVAVNCAAIPDTLLESELFGHKRGAFSGATTDRKGLVETSSGGTLFLDEIGELSPKGQASLLRVLEQQEVMPVGANRPVTVDLRVVAATHRSLLDDIGEGVFREDLYARLSTFVATIPPLRERMAEIGSIVATLLASDPNCSEELCFAPDAGRTLLRYTWPRNIRELKKTLISAAVLAESNRIELDDLASLVMPSTVTADASPSALSDDDRALHEQLIALLATHKGNVTQVGNAIGKKRQQIQKWCKRLGIDPKQFR